MSGMGMDSHRLSLRRKQPGHDRTFLTSETNFISQAAKCLDPEKYEIDPKPRDLLRIFESLAGGRNLGVQPEAAIISKQTGRKFFVEVKKQGAGGNAEERACKHHTVQFYATLKALFSYDYHPYVTVFCESLATNPRYTSKFVYLFEPDHYFLWADYDPAALAAFLNARCAAWLDPQ
jgi:hypothetical protein